MKTKRTVIEALHDLNNLERTKDVIDKETYEYLSTKVFPEEIYDIDKKVEDVCGCKALGITCTRGGLKSCRMVVILLDLEESLIEGKIDDIRRVGKKLADSESCIGIILILHRFNKDNADKEIANMYPNNPKLFTAHTFEYI